MEGYQRLAGAIVPTRIILAMIDFMLRTEIDAHIQSRNNTHIAKNTIVSIVALTEEAVDIIQASAMLARSGDAIIDVHLAHLSGEARCTLTSMSKWLDIDVGHARSMIGTVRMVRARVDALRTGQTSVPSRAYAHETIQTIDARASR